MKENNFSRALLAVAIGAFSCVLQAKELVIPTLPSAQQKQAEVVSGSNSGGINLADYGVGVETPKPQSAKPEEVAQRAAPVASSTAEERKAAQADLLQVTGGGRDGDLQPVPSAVARTEQMPAPQEVPSYQEVVVQPGVNTIIPAAINHLNRIVTPFENPIVQTVSSAQIKVKENVIYVSTEDQSPVTMYITPKEDESVAISLTLAPRKVPPIQANLVLGEAPGGSGRVNSGAGAGGGFHYSGQARKWEEGQPYMEAIKGIMRSLALGQIPKGYSIGKAGRRDTVPACLQDGIDFDFASGQIIMGHNFRVVVGVARNSSQVPQMFDETSCTHPTLAATAVWPLNMLEPGQKTEVYVVTRTGEAPAEESMRPSLLN